jgi:DNA-binding CsgD family transcriptional regulator
MAAPSILSFDRAGWNDRPWMRVLETFGIPFLCYDSAGRCTHVSGVANAMLGCEPVGAAIRAEADAIVLEENRRHPPMPIGDFALMREVRPAFDGIVLALYSVRAPFGDRCTVVVMRPSSPSIGGEPIDGLTSREAGVARLLAAGLSAKAIASQLGISPHTARHHIERVYTKLGVRRGKAVAHLVAARIK